MRAILLKVKYKDSVDGFVQKVKFTEANLSMGKQMVREFSSSLMDHIIRVSGKMTSSMEGARSSHHEVRNT